VGDGQGALEDVEMTSDGFWAGRRVMVTGHTGFKGAWLAFWLAERGASVCGLALAPEPGPSLYQQLGLGGRVDSVFADINDAVQLNAVMSRARPEIVFHLAAQALVRRSYAEPVETFATNVLGTVQLLQAVRGSEARAVVVVTSDKAYENREWPWGYRESDQLGGHDPYSASKAAAELAVNSMRRSYFSPYRQGGHPARLATVRAGNVIGGGDWAAERLVPDIVRSCLAGDDAVTLRNPASVRPWQHVLDPLAFYMELAERLITSPERMDEAWNIGPDLTESHTVQEVARLLIEVMGKGRLKTEVTAANLHEAGLLALDCAKARRAFGWRPRWGFAEAIHHTAEWYLACHRGGDPVAVSRAQIAAFEQKALRTAAEPDPEY
jgi:CDP-glucose 4,6-dehydratase